MSRIVTAKPEHRAAYGDTIGHIHHTDEALAALLPAPAYPSSVRQAVLRMLHQFELALPLFTQDRTAAGQSVVPSMLPAYTGGGTTPPADSPTHTVDIKLPYVPVDFITRLMVTISRTVHVTNMWQDRVEVVWSLDTHGVAAVDEHARLVRLQAWGHRSLFLRSLLFDAVQQLTVHRYASLAEGVEVSVVSPYGDTSWALDTLRKWPQPSIDTAQGPVTVSSLVQGLVGGVSTAATLAVGEELDAGINELEQLSRGGSGVAIEALQLHTLLFKWASLRMGNRLPFLWVPLPTSTEVTDITLSSPDKWGEGVCMLRPVCGLVTALGEPLHVPVAVDEAASARHLLSREALVHGSSYFLRMLRFLAATGGVEVATLRGGDCVETRLVSPATLTALKDGILKACKGRRHSVAIGVEQPVGSPDVLRSLLRSMGHPLSQRDVFGQKVWVCRREGHLEEMEAQADAQEGASVPPAGYAALEALVYEHDKLVRGFELWCCMR